MAASADSPVLDTIDDKQGYLDCIAALKGVFQCQAIAQEMHVMQSVAPWWTRGLWIQ
jgi:hypothetical protein